MNTRILYLIRHAQIGSHVASRFIGITDVPLSDEGVHQASKISQRYPETNQLHVWSSPLRRATATAHAAFPKADILAVPLAMEFNFGNLEGLLPAEASRLFPEAACYFQTHPLDASPFGGEHWSELALRAAKLASSIEKAGSLVLVSHRYFLSVLVSSLLQKPWNAFCSSDLGYAECLVLQKKPSASKWQMDDGTR